MKERRILMASRELFEMDNYNTLRNNMAYLIESRGYEHNIVASAIGVTDVSLSRYINGVRKPELQYIIKFAQFFNVSLEWLVGYKPKTSRLSSDDSMLVDCYNKATEDDRKAVDNILSNYSVSD